MRLFRRRSNELRVPSPPGQRSSLVSRIDWKRAIPRLVALLLITAAIVFGIIWVVGALTKDEPQPPSKKQPAIARPAKEGQGDQGLTTSERPSDSQSVNPSPQMPATRKPSAGVTPSKAAPGGVSEPAAGSSASGIVATSQNGKLTDTGPGETIALFAIATATGSIAYQVNLRRRLN